MQGTSQNIAWQNPATKGCSNTPFSLRSCKLSFNSRKILLGFVGFYICLQRFSATQEVTEVPKKKQQAPCSAKHQDQLFVLLHGKVAFSLHKSHGISLILTSFFHLALCTSLKKSGVVKQLISHILVAIFLTRDKQRGGPCTLLCECNDRSMSSSTPISSYRLQTHFWHCRR